MDDEIRDAVRAYRAATTTGRSDPTRRAIWRDLEHKIEQRAPAPVVPDRSPWFVVAAAVALAAALVAVFGGLGSDDAVHTPRTRPNDQAIDASDDARTGSGATRERGAADIVPAELDPSVLPRPAVEAAPPTTAATPRTTQPATPARPSEVSAPTERPPSPELEREATLLLRARQAAMAHDRAGARAALDAHAQQFPRGALAQERWTLSIELLCDAGDLDAAARTAASFARAYPGAASAAALHKRPCDSMTKPDTDGHHSAEAR